MVDDEIKTVKAAIEKANKALKTAQKQTIKHDYNKLNEKTKKNKQGRKSNEVVAVVKSVQKELQIGLQVKIFSNQKITKLTFQKYFDIVCIQI